MIKKIVFDGNDGTGKSFRLNEMKKIFPTLEYEDRGIFSEMTLNENIFKKVENSDTNAVCDKVKELYKFYNHIAEDSTTLYIICDTTPEICQKRISARGDSLDEEYHRMEDLIKFRERFNVLYYFVKELPNVMMVDTSDDII